MPLQRGDRVLVDTNVIIEAHRVGCWRAIASEFRLITVEKVIEESQTGHQNRSPEQNIDETRLRESFHRIGTVTRAQLAALQLDQDVEGLDDGELHLVILAAHLDDAAWLLNSPDKGTIRFCSRVGWLDRLMVDALGLPHGRQLRRNHTEDWLRPEITRFRLGLR